MWKKGEKKARVDYTADISDKLMKEQWHFSKEDIEMTRELKTIISIPFLNINNEVIGILSIDSPFYISPSKIDEYHLFERVYAIRDNLAASLNGKQPISFRGYMSLRNVLGSARLIPPLPIPIRVGAFWIDKVQQNMYMFVASDAFASPYLKADLRFKKNQALIGRVWAEENFFFEDREVDLEKRRQNLTKLNMDEDQINVAIDTLSILTMPITYDDDTNEIIGVLVINSVEPMEKSKLKDNLTLVVELAKLAGKVLARERLIPKTAG
jgi:hypothetical protein